MAILSPKNINKKLEAWYDASVTSSLLLSGSSLTGWNDLSNTSSHLDTIQGTAPQLSTRKVNNRTVVEFNNDGAVFRNIQVEGTVFPQATIAFVCVPDAYDGTVVSSRTAIDNRVSIVANGTVSMVFSTTGFTSNNRCKTGEVTRIIASYNGDSSKIWVNGFATNAPAGLIEDRILIAMIGAGGSGDTNYFDGLVCEAVIYEDALTESEVLDLDQYFQRKWNPFSNKIQFDTSANGYTSNVRSDSSLNNTITVNVPTNVANGDLMLAVLHINAANNPGFISPPSGWTELANNFNINGNFALHTWIAYRLANTEPSSYQWAIDTAGGDDQGWIFKIDGANKNSVIDSIGTISDQVALNQSVTPFTTNYDNSMVVYIAGGKNGNNLKANGSDASPINTTQLLYRKTRGFSAAVGAAIAYEYKPFAGNTGTKSFTIYDTTAAYSSTFAFAIKQAPYSVVQAERLIETGKVKQFSDNFNRADTAYGNIGPDWDIITGSGRGSFRIINNQFDATGFAYAKVSENIVDFSDDHSAQITVRALGVGDPLGPAVRVNANGCYVLRCDGGTTGERRINYVNDTTYTVIGNVTITPNVGDTLKLTAQGSVITAYRNGVQVDQVSNTAYTTGQPGIHYNRSNINVSKGDDFYAEDLNSPTSGTMVKMHDDGTIRAGFFSEKEFLDRIKYHYDGDIWAGKFIESE